MKPASSSLDTTLNALGAVIRRRREDVGLSQDELGHLSGLHRTYVGSVERGERNLTLSSLIALCRALQIAPHQLLQRVNL
ncbi:MAG TPA: helix-turn-helix transcriptional regulator [Tepidisphaeraceae bacterium]|nr:helix-turn-helix transcriptional regulator [Tepidisphaeraceae bacterium]